MLRGRCGFATICSLLVHDTWYITACSCLPNVEGKELLKQRAAGERGQYHSSSSASIHVARGYCQPYCRNTSTHTPFVRPLWRQEVYWTEWKGCTIAACMCGSTSPDCANLEPRLVMCTAVCGAVVLLFR